MLRARKTRLAPDRRIAGTDEGFTLIELMVVVLIIAVLLAIAIPTFLGSQSRAKDRSAQSSVRNTLTAARSIFVDGADYTKVTSGAGTLKASEPSLTFNDKDTASADPKTVSINAASATLFYAAAKSGSGSCFYIRDDVTLNSATVGVMYSKGPTTDTCSGTTAAGKTYSATGW